MVFRKEHIPYWALVLLGLILLLLPRDLPAAEASQQSGLMRLIAADIALQRGDIATGLGQYIVVAKETRDEKVAAMATELALTYADVTTALVPAQIWAEAAPMDAEAQLTTAAIYIRLGQPFAAVPFLSALARIDENLADQHFIVLYTELSSDADKRNVMIALEALQKSSPNQSSAAIALADIALQEGHPDKALVWAKNALEKSPKSANASIVMAESLRQTQGPVQAEQFLQSQIGRTTEDASLRHYLAQLYWDTENPEKAHQELVALAKVPNLPSPLLLQLTRLSMQGQWFDLSKSFLNAAKADPEYEDTAVYFLGRISELEQKPSDALGWYRQVKDGPFAVMSALRASFLLQDTKSYAEALQVLDSVTPVTVGDLKRLVLSKSDILIRLNQYDEACQTLTKTLSIIQNDVDLLFIRGIAYERLKEYQNAEADWRHVIALQPENAHAASSLGQLLWRTGKESQAQSVLEEALKVNPDNPYILKAMEKMQ